MLFSWWRRRRRRGLVARPFPDDWEAVLKTNFPRVERLGGEGGRKLRGDIQVLVAEKNWEGVFGLEMDDEVRVTIAAQASWLVLGRDVSCFDNVLSILVYPDAYSAPEQFTISNGIVIEGRSQRLGEAWHRGPVVLSWPDVLRGGRNPGSGRNLVFHEFAHQLDMLNGRHVDGTPPLDSAELTERWRTIVSREYQQLQVDCRYGRSRLLDCYGATNPGEFFAVATETFFQQPVRMRRRHPELFQVLCDYFRQDPAERITQA
jgi:Mlc titration factor MtfA (ptsG expression regulator)